ncbi:MAG: hypothetical protein NTW29_03920 [Bacteroidetes bacterium]|nr:hypothetical protein [Bacteroidota bacterium]
MKRVLITIFTLISIHAASQTEADIRKHYNEVNEQIKESIELGFEGPLYQNQLVINKNGRSWPAVGNYSDTVNFWYNDPPDHLPAIERNPKNVLVKVNLSRVASGFRMIEEYLYKDGKLLFYYSFQAEEGKKWETRAWFNNKGIMIRSSVKADDRDLTSKELLTTEFKDFKPKPLTILAEAKKFQDLFIKSM